MKNATIPATLAREILNFLALLVLEMPFVRNFPMNQGNVCAVITISMMVLILHASHVILHAIIVLVQAIQIA